MASYDLTAPGGTKVAVDGAERRDVLLARGYTQADAAPPVKDPAKGRPAQPGPK